MVRVDGDRIRRECVEAFTFTHGVDPKGKPRSVTVIGHHNAWRCYKTTLGSPRLLATARWREHTHTISGREVLP